MKELLSNKGITFEEKDITVNHQFAEELTNVYGYRSVPVTVAGDKVILGFSPEEIEAMVH